MAAGALAFVALGLVGWWALRSTDRPRAAAGQVVPGGASTAAATSRAAPRAAANTARAGYERYGLPAPVDPSPDEASSPCGAACACLGSEDPCRAGRACAARGCDEPLEGRAWRVRLGGLDVRPPASLDENAKVCIGVVGARAPVCTALREQRAAGCARGSGLRVTTEQLVGDGLEIEVVDGAGRVVARAARASYAALTQRELCRGVRFGGGKFTGALPVESVTLWLDDG